MQIMLTQVKNNQKITTDLTKIRDFQELSSSLKAIQPPGSQTMQIITYTLIATAVVGIFVYHYIKNQEAL